MFIINPATRRKAVRLTKKALNKAVDIIDDSLVNVEKELNKNQLGSVKSVMEQIKSIANQKEKRRELFLQAKAHALAYKELEQLRQELESKTPLPSISYNTLDHKHQKQVDKIFKRILEKLNSPAFIKQHHTPEQAKLDRDRIIHDLIQAKKYDIRRFQDLARHYHQKLNLDL